MISILNEKTRVVISFLKRSICILNLLCFNLPIILLKIKREEILNIFVFYKY